MSPYEEIAREYSYPAILTKNSEAQLLDSLASLKADKSRMPQFAIGLKGEIPLGGLYALSDVVKIAAAKMGLPPAEQKEFSSMIVEEVLPILGLKRAYLGELLLVEWRFWPFPSSTTELACALKGSHFSLNRDFDIPYLAGYSLDGKTIYIDRNYPEPIMFPKQGPVSTIPYLEVHEAFEKSLMDLLKLKEKLYLRTHQIAQRLEKKCVEAANLNWDIYDRILDPEIDRADDPKHSPTRVPANLDLTPYRDYADWELIRKMKKVMR